MTDNLKKICGKLSVPRVRSQVGHGGAGGLAFELIDRIDLVGAPSFAYFAKGGYHSGLRCRFGQNGNLMLQTASYPPLRQAQGRLLQKIRKDGAPTVIWLPQSKGWATRQ